MYFLIESFSNDDDAGNENAILKHEYFFSVLATFFAIISIPINCHGTKLLRND